MESPRPQQDNFDDEKVRYISSEISIWDFFGIHEATYRAFLAPEKSKMFTEYYAKLCDKYYGSTGKNFLFWFYCLCVFQPVSGLCRIFFCLFLAQRFPSTVTDSGISQTIRNSNEISISKSIFPDNMVDTTITAEKTSFKRNTVDVWPDHVYLRQ